jgi:hypothetical protein
MVEFLGGSDIENATCAYITQSDGCRFMPSRARSPSEIDWFRERDYDVSRSLFDFESLLFHLDIEYVNFDSPEAAFVNPWHAFEIQQPVVLGIETLLLEWGIRPLHLITGQGHHFVWRIRRKSKVFERISSLLRASESLRQFNRRFQEPMFTDMDEASQDAFAGQALLMEHLAHRVRSCVASACSVPVKLTAVHVGPDAAGKREIVSVDISEYGDPLTTRMIRVPFSTYRKPWINGMAKQFEGQIPKIYTIPLHEMDVPMALKVRQDAGDVIQLARCAPSRIPDETAGTGNLLEDYLQSELRGFHRHFYDAEHDPPSQWHTTHHAARPHGLPACVTHILQHPNDLLLKPAGIELVTRCLLAEGWHPRHIAGLIRSKFEDESFGWSDEWQIYDPGARADFYTRLFSGLHFTGMQKLVDFNCRSNQEKGFCFGSGCSLDPYRQRLLSAAIPSS